MKKKNDGSVALTCVRPDGTSTWQRQEGAVSRFFPFHDLTHYVVETTLGQRGGFYGLVAGGWDLGDFASPWPRGRIPADAGRSELIVGFFDAERASGDRWTAHDFNDRARAWALERELPGEWALTEDDIARIRALRAELFARWRALPHGETLELVFDPLPGVPRPE